MARVLASGLRFAGFELLRELGAGGFGITYLVRDLKTGVHYAMKEYFPEQLAQRDGMNVKVIAGHEARFTAGLEAFFKEADVLRTLPAVQGLIAVRGLFRRNGTAYVVMEFVDGPSLTGMILSYLEKQRPFPEDLIRSFMLTIGTALSVVHKAGLIHRDIKPDNILIRKQSGQAILIDFGAARHSRDQAGFSPYTPSFAALEQLPRKLRPAEGHMKEGPWTDFFALSMVAYVMMTGHKAASTEDRIKAISAGQPDPYRPVAELAATSYSKVLCDLVDFGCALEPLKRPATAREYLSKIGGLSNSIPLREPSLSGGASGTAHRGLRDFLILASVAALIAGAIWLGMTQ